MQVVSNKKEIIFRNEYEGRAIYRIGISKKNKDGSYSSSTMLCKFPKDVDIKNKTLIIIKNAWIDFYLRNNDNDQKEGVPYIFINEFVVVGEIEDKKEEKEIDPYEEFGKRVEIQQSPDLPF